MEKCQRLQLDQKWRLGEFLRGNRDIYVVCPYTEIIIPSLDRNMAQDLDLGMSGMKERAESDT